MATSFVAEILTSAGQLEKEEILTKLGRLTKRVSEIKLEVYELTKKRYYDFVPSLKQAEDLSEDVQTLSKEMDSVSKTIDEEIKSQLNMSTGEFQTLSAQLQETNATLAIAEKLMKMDELFNTVSTATRQEEFLTAARALLNINTQLSFPVMDGEEEICALQNLRTEYSVRKAEFIMDLGEFWNTRVVWKIPEEKLGSSASFPVELTLVHAGRGKAAIEEAVSAMEKMNILEKKLKPFSDRLVLHMIKPLVSNESAKAEFSENKGEKKVKLVKKTEEKVVVSKPAQAFDKLENLLDFLFKFLLNISTGSTTKSNKGDVTLMERLGRLSADKVIDIIVKECLVNAIPSSKAELEKFREVVMRTEKFNAKLLSLNFLSESNKGLLDFVGNVKVLFANKKCQEIVECARNLMTSEIYNTVVISPVKPIGELPPLDPEAPALKRQKVAEKLASDVQLSENITRLPVCHISTSIQSMMSLAYGTLQEAVDSSEQCAIQLFYALRSIFELFCSAFPRYHKQSLAMLPQLAAIHHNNCFFIAHHLMTLGHQFSMKLPSQLKDGSGTFVDMVIRIRKIGTDCFLEQMTAQKSQLLEYLQGAQGFSSVAEEENYMSTQKSLKQVLHQLCHLQRVWQGVLPPNIYSKAIGTLVNSVVIEIISNIVALEDISADDATQLHGLLSEFSTNLASLFKGKDEDVNIEVQLQKNVHKWRKYKELLLLLNAGLQDISDRWADGKGLLAVEFNSNEVKPLIRALFQNTDRRAAVLARIH